jgi:hypothetical protein
VAPPPHPHGSFSDLQQKGNSVNHKLSLKKGNPVIINSRYKKIHAIGNNFQKTEILLSKMFFLKETLVS